MSVVRDTAFTSSPFVTAIEPISETDDEIRAFLEAAELPPLLPALAYLTGDMSLVGPRPHALSHDHEYQERISLYARRHNVKPGITGWAQIHGCRGEIDTDEKMRRRLEHDLFYIDNWSFWLDLQIIFRTVLSPAGYRNAY